MDVEQDRRRSHASGPSAGVYDARWSPRAHRLLQATQILYVDGLRQPLRRCLGELECHLFALAERVHRADQQQDLYASRQRVMQGRSLFEERFIAQLDIAFTEIGHTPRSMARSDTRPWQSLALLDPAEQELRLAMEQLGARGETRHSGVLYELGYRLAVLIAAPPLEGPALPLGPHALTKAFHHAGLKLLLPPEHHLLLLQALDQWVIQSLAPLLESINDQLQADGLLPQLRSIPVPRHIGKHTRSAKADPAAVVATAPAAGGNAAGVVAGASIEVLESLRNLLAQRRGGALAGSRTAAGHVASQDELQTALGALQQHLAHVTEHASRELRSAQRLREELIAQLNVDKPAGAPLTQLTGEQGDTVELVATRPAVAAGRQRTSAAG